MPALLKDTLPELASELEQLLVKAGEGELASQVPRLSIVDRCRCGDEFCATFYTEPPPRGAFGEGHRNVVLAPAEGMLILDVVLDVIACVEVLYRPSVRRELLLLLP
jgi:hypothetical protein